jgi:hypothetical protein
VGGFETGGVRRYHGKELSQSPRSAFAIAPYSS